MLSLFRTYLYCFYVLTLCTHHFIRIYTFYKPFYKWRFYKVFQIHTVLNHLGLIISILYDSIFGIKDSKLSRNVIQIFAILYSILNELYFIFKNVLLCICYFQVNSNFITNVLYATGYHTYVLSDTYFYDLCNGIVYLQFRFLFGANKTSRGPFQLELQVMLPFPFSYKNFH